MSGRQQQHRASSGATPFIAQPEEEAKPVELPARAYPGNADVRRCRWYLGSDRSPGPGTVEVHLWGLAVPATDSRRGEGWAVRRCVMCGIPDEESLKAQYEHFEKLDALETTEGP